MSDSLRCFSRGGHPLSPFAGDAGSVSVLQSPRPFPHERIGERRERRAKQGKVSAVRSAQRKFANACFARRSRVVRSTAQR
ncbi:hypothetical protein L1889_17860 [Paenalcaligenes niemegkensis]|uniref:hypothetical protein n=1 Tax=Paenalcaligenes niemegkensis TaxID=2895469 RepID=UPI001EE840AD|nr:hypothetical protein [Paenalcaligenes niemegkensis]MCQ9618318.1 hypothetical protein [Paenalcaligenes niemegkensis]